MLCSHLRVARPRQAVQTMESFLRWWRGGSSGERRTINTTPLPQRYELYHRKRRNEGVSLIAACCIAFNLVMGSGFLALPAAVARCGLILTNNDGRRLSGYAHVARLGGRGHGES